MQALILYCGDAYLSGGGKVREKPVEKFGWHI
jgi:hypothetical protein